VSGFYLTQLANGWTVGRFAALDRATNISHMVATGVGLDVHLAKSDRGAAAQLVAAAMGLGHGAYCDQVHGTKVHCVDGGGLAGAGDGLMTATAGLALCAFSADCPLILVADPRGGAVGLAHASWRATVGLIAMKLVARMIESPGVRSGDLIACICPSAGPCCYEVGPDVVHAAAMGIGPEAGKFFASRGGKTYFDLWAANVDQLVRAGMDPDRIDVARVCTICGPEVFPSFRRQGDAAGRFVAAIASMDN
jgi:YfiH family protein